MTRLARIVQDALDQLDWTDEIDDDEATGQSHVATTALIDEQSCRVFIDTNEEQDAISVFLYPPFYVKAAHYPEACLLVNAINVQVRHGHLEIVPDAGLLRVVLSADVEGASPTGLFVVRMLQCGHAVLGEWLGALAAVGICGRPAATVLAEMTAPAAEAEPAAAGAEGTAPVTVGNPSAARTLH